MTRAIVLIMLSLIISLTSVAAHAQAEAQTASSSTCTETSKGLMHSWKTYAKFPADKFKRQSGYDKAAYFAATGDAGALSKYLDSVRHEKSSDAYRAALADALDAAILWRHQDIMQSLVKRGAPLDGISDSNVHPLHVAVSCRDYKTIRFLVGHGANLYVKAGPHSDALWEAVVMKDRHSVQLLLNAGFDPCFDHKRPNGRGAVVARSSVAAKLGFPEDLVTRLRCRSD